MQIELRNIKIANSLSEETTAFTATLYVDGKALAHCKNDGQGGPTDYRIIDSELMPLLKKAEEHCIQLPALKLEGGGTWPMNLETFIDGLLDDHIEQKEAKKFTDKMEKKMVNSVVFGTPGKEFSYLSFKFPLAEMLANPNGPAALIKTIKERVIPAMKPGQVILNTNLSADFIHQCLTKTTQS